MTSHFARYVANLRQSLYDEQMLNGKFLELETYATPTPGFLEEICAGYFRHVVKFLDLMVLEVQGPPYNSLLIDRLLNHFWTRTSNFGAAKVRHQIDCMRNNLKDGDFDACKIAFAGIKRECELLQLKLENYFKVKKQGPPTEIEDRPEYGDMDTDSE